MRVKLGLCLGLGLQICAWGLGRTFPANTLFGILHTLNYPQLDVQELPSNWGSSLLGAILLHSKNLSLTPASIVRDQQNNTHVQSYLSTLINQSIAIQPDFQGRVWLVWELTPSETKWVIQNKLNFW